MAFVNVHAAFGSDVGLVAGITNASEGTDEILTGAVFADGAAQSALVDVVA